MGGTRHRRALAVVGALWLAAGPALGLDVLPGELPPPPPMPPVFETLPAAPALPPLPAAELPAPPPPPPTPAVPPAQSPPFPYACIQDLCSPDSVPGLAPPLPPAGLPALPPAQPPGVPAAPAPGAPARGTMLAGTVAMTGPEGACRGAQQLVWLRAGVPAPPLLLRDPPRLAVATLGGEEPSPDLLSPVACTLYAGRLSFFFTDSQVQGSWSTGWEARWVSADGGEERRARIGPYGDGTSIGFEVSWNTTGGGDLNLRVAAGTLRDPAARPV